MISMELIFNSLHFIVKRAINRLQEEPFSTKALFAGGKKKKPLGKPIFIYNYSQKEQKLLTPCNVHV